MDTRDPVTSSFRPGAIIGGLVLLGLGAALLLDRTGTLRIDVGHFIAPFVLIVIGATMTFESTHLAYMIPERAETGDVRLRGRRRRMPMGGLWLVWIGVWMLVSQNHLWGLTFETSWPLLLIMMGLMTVIRGWR